MIEDAKHLQIFNTDGIRPNGLEIWKTFEVWKEFVFLISFLPQLLKQDFVVQDWMNGQYLHKLSLEELTPLVAKQWVSSNILKK